MIPIEYNKINNIPLKWGRTPFVTVEDYECLYDNCKGYKDYIEIGTMFGGSAIVAGYAVTGEVHCIDPFGVKGSPHRKEQVSGFLVKPEYVRENWALHHGVHRLFIHKQRHPPFPTYIEHRVFDVGLIDGCHDVDAVQADWEGLKNRVKYKILFHDVNYKGEGWDVNSTAEKNAAGVFNDIIHRCPDWEFLEIRGKMGVLKRR